MLKRIYADNFRCLGNFEFRPGQINLLLGENGSGKSSLLDVLQCIRELVVNSQPVGDQFRFTKTIWDQRDVQSFELEVEAGGGTFDYRLEIQHSFDTRASQKMLIKAESLSFDKKSLFCYTEGQVHLFNEDHSPGAQFPFKAEHSFLPNVERNSKIQAFKSFLARISVFQLSPFGVEAESEKDQPYLSRYGSDFAAWLRYLNEDNPQAKLDCEAQLKEIIPRFLRFRFKTTGERSKLLVADFGREDGANYWLTFNLLSEGHRILSMLYAILYGLVGSSSVLCFDEPENFISIPEIQPWLRNLRDRVEEHSGQILLISHHPEVIDYLAVDSAFRFERPTGDLARVSEWTPDPTLIMKPSEILARWG